jgi:hypothetical protein
LNLRAASLSLLFVGMALACGRTEDIPAGGGTFDDGGIPRSVFEGECRCDTTAVAIDGTPADLGRAEPVAAFAIDEHGASAMSPLDVACFDPTPLRLDRGGESG